jgi:4a-hydroxytetrahydrobiopterin dehydratase
MKVRLNRFHFIPHPSVFILPKGGRMESLSSKSCVPCQGGVPRLEGKEIAALLGQLNGWRVVDEHHLHKAYKFTNFADALAFVNRVGEIAEAEGHHPDISFGWGYARLEIYTHAIGGLSESDFILAAKIDEA